MKSTLRFSLALSAAMLFWGYAQAQQSNTPLTATKATNAVQFNEPTIDGTLDVIPDLVVNKEARFDIFITAGDRGGDPVNVVITLLDPSQRNNFVMEQATDATGATFVPVVFNEQGVAKLGPQGGEPLADMQKYFKITFSEAGIYRYRLDLLRMDQNIVGTMTEATRVSSVAGTDDMIDNNRLVVYPTISNGTVNVDLGQVRNADLQVLDMLGRVVYSAGNQSGRAQIDTRQFGKGLYFVKVVKDGDAAVLRFLVK
jgi:hypothetical protein